MKKPFVKNLMLGLRLDEFVEGLVHHVLYETSDYATCGNPTKDSVEQWWERLIRVLVQARDPKIRFARSSESLFVLSPKIDLAPREYEPEDWGRARGDIVKLNRFVKDFYGTR